MKFSQFCSRSNFFFYHTFLSKQLVSFKNQLPIPFKLKSIYEKNPGDFFKETNVDWYIFYSVLLIQLYKLD